MAHLCFAQVHKASVVDASFDDLAWKCLMKTKLSSKSLHSSFTSVRAFNFASLEIIIAVLRIELLIQHDMISHNFTYEYPHIHLVRHPRHETRGKRKIPIVPLPHSLSVFAQRRCGWDRKQSFFHKTLTAQVLWSAWFPLHLNLRSATPLLPIKVAPHPRNIACCADITNLAPSWCSKVSGIQVSLRAWGVQCGQE